MANKIKKIKTNNLKIVPPIEVKCAVWMCNAALMNHLKDP